MSLARIALVNKETKVVEQLVVISQENYEKDFADLVDHYSNYDCVNAESWEDPEGTFVAVGIGFTYNGTTFVPYEITKNEISQEDIQKSLDMVARDIALGGRPDLESKPENAEGPKEDAI